MKKTYLEKLNYRLENMDAELPEKYLDKLLSEGNRVQENILMPRKLSDRKILIIGGAGYIGIPFTFNLLSRGYSVRCLDLLLYQNRDAVNAFLGQPGYEFIKGDMNDSNVVSDALNGVTDVIILAGLVGDPITKKYPEQSAKVNDDGINNVISNLNNKGLNKVIFVSTCSNYGEIPFDATADENYELKPLSLYAKSKVNAEKTLLGKKDNVDYVGTVLRFATAFGLSGRMRFDLTVSEFTRDLYSGNTLEVFDADTWRPYCHVQDFSLALLRVLEAPVDDVAFDVFNAGGEINNYTKQMMVDAILKHLPEGNVKYIDGGVDRRNYRVNFSKIKEKLYFEPKFSIDDGISELIDSLKKGFYHDYEARLNFYRNNEITYS